MVLWRSEMVVKLDQYTINGNFWRGKEQKRSTSGSDQQEKNLNLAFETQENVEKKGGKFRWNPGVWGCRGSGNGFHDGIEAPPRAS
jgi:hypothetical protein